MLEILFQFGSVTVRTFNIVLAFAFLFTGAFAIRFVTRQKLNISFLARSILIIFAAMIVGGRLLYVIEHWPMFRSGLIYALYIWDLHFSFFGVLYGLIVSLLFLSRKNDEDFWSWFDVGALSTVFAMIFLHIGHFLNGTNYGLPTDLPWSISFDVQNIPFVNPIHPTQIYAALLAFIIFIYSLKKSRRTHLSGVAGNIAIMLYSLSMLGLDFLRGAPSLYVKISFGIIAVLSFIFLVLCSHKTHHKSLKE